VNPGAAASIFIGGNDVINERPSTTAQANDLAARIVSDIGDAVSTLSQAGTQHFILYTLPDVSIPPQSDDLSAAEVAAADATVAAANRGINALAAQVSPFADVTVVDVNRLELEVVADRETFGIEVVDTPLYDKVGDRLIPTEIRSQFSANEVAFFDPLHPTAAVHRIIAAFSEATLEADRVVFRTSGNDTIVGSFAHDFYMGGIGEDRLSGRSGHDVLLAGAGEDRVDGGTGGDLISGGGGNDLLRGRSYYDLLAGNDGDDTIFGGTASDIIIGGTGGDQVLGQSGNDFFYFTNDGLGNGFDFVNGGTGRDTLRVTVSTTLFDSQEFKQELQDFATFLDVAPGGSFTFDLLDLNVTSIERLEVEVRGRTVDAVGADTPEPHRFLAAALHDADLWGMA
jgi:Ca2+-binding RTX toxin-like protein